MLCKVVNNTVNGIDAALRTGIVVGYWNGNSSATSYTSTKAGGAVVLDGTYTRLTAANYNSYTQGTTNSGGSHVFNITFNGNEYVDPDAGEDEGGSGVKLSAPTNVTLTILYNSVTVSWDEVEGAEWYIVEYKKKSADEWTVSDRISSTSYTLTDLDHGTEYLFRVKAFASNSSGYSSETDGSTLDEVDLDAPVVTVGTANPKSIVLNWGAVDKATGYTVEYKLPDSETWTVASATVTGTTYEVGSLKPTTTYDFRVKALGEGGNEGKYSEVVSGTTSEVSYTYPLTLSNTEDFVEWINLGAEFTKAGDVATLGADIDLTGQTYATVSTFAGTLDGAGKTVKGIDKTLFSSIAGSGEVKNLTLEGAISQTFGAESGTGHPLAALALVSAGSVTGCTNKVTVTMTSTGILGSPVVAGLVAFHKDGTFSGNTNLATVTLTTAGTANATVTGFNRKPFVVTAGVVGVIVGATAENCTNEGTVKVGCTNVSAVGARHYVGGVVGTPEDARIIKCTNKGAVTADFTDAAKSAAKQVWVGGVIGGRNGDIKTIDGAYVEGCSNYGEITLVAENAVNNYLAGIGGQPCVEATGTSYTADASTMQKIVDCHNYGKLVKKGAGGCRAGGISGGAATLENCSNAGEIVIENISTSGAVGGLVGYPTQSYHPVTGCTNTGNLTATCDVVFAMGGLFGQGGNTAQNYSGCKVDCTITAPDSVLAGIVLGTAKTLASNKTITYGTADAPFKVKGSVKGTAITADNYTTFIASDGAPSNGKITTAAGGSIDVTYVQFGE